MTLRELLEQRSALIQEMRSYTSNPAGDGGDLSTEQTAKFDEARKKLEGVEKRIERQKLLDEAEQRMQGVTLHEGNGSDRFDTMCREASLTRAIAAMIDPHSVDAGKEREISQELSRRSGRKPQGMFVPLTSLVERRSVERRTQTVAGDAGNLVQESVLADQFIDALRPATVLGALGARMLTGLRDDIAIPKMDSNTPEAEWLETEGTSALSGGDHSFTQVTGKPKIVGLKTEWSRKTMLQANPSIEQLVRADFTRKLAVAVDRAGLRGTGATGQPEGILTNSSIHEESISGGDVTWPDVLGCIAQVLGSDVRGGSFGWTFNAFVQKILRSTLKETGDAAAGYIMQAANALADYPVQITSSMPGFLSSPEVEGQMLFGDFSQVILAFWGDAGADVLVNPYADAVYSKGNVLIRAFVDADVLIRHPEGFCKIQNISMVQL
jgi:HK97 family phage major capsid protein